MGPKPWDTVKSEINTLPKEQLITPSISNNVNTPVNSEPIIIKKDSRQVDNSTSIINQNVNNNQAQQQSNDPINNNQIGSNLNSYTGLSNNNYGGYNSSGYGSMYGGMGGGYGMGMGGYGSYGGMYGGMGGGYGIGMGMGGYGMRPMMNQNDPDFLDRCFQTIERMNFQLFHLCELARMIQQQSAALTFLYEMISKVYSVVKTYAKENMISLFSSIKNGTISKLIRLREIVTEFLNTSPSTEDSKLKKHLKILDKMLIVLLTISVAGYLGNFVVTK